MGENLCDLTRVHFSHRSFEQLLERFLDAGYTFHGFHETGAVTEAESRLVLMRRDIDMEFDPAFDIAQIEASKGVRFTFFFMLNTEHYNRFSTYS